MTLALSKAEFFVILDLKLLCARLYLLCYINPCKIYSGGLAALLAGSDVIRVVSCKRFGESGRLIELVLYKPSIPIFAISLILRKR